MKCMQQALSCLEVTVVRLELSSDLLVPRAFACRVLVCLVSHVIIFRECRKSLYGQLGPFFKVSQHHLKSSGDGVLSE